MKIQAKLGTRYCIDTNALINLKDRYGPPSSHKARKVWESLENMIKRGELISHERVYAEIRKGRDDLAVWCKRYKGMFHEINEWQIANLQSIKSTYNQNYWAIEIQRNSEWADPWIIALSICEGSIIITDENPQKEMSIPKIANHFGLKSISSQDFLKNLKIV